MGREAHSGNQIKGSLCIREHCSQDSAGQKRLELVRAGGQEGGSNFLFPCSPSRQQAGEQCADGQGEELEDAAGFRLGHTETMSAYPKDEASFRKQLWPLSL